MNAGRHPVLFGTAKDMVQIPAGRFQMGSPSKEVGRSEDETLHQGDEAQTWAEMEKIEAQFLQKRLKAYRSMQNDISIDSQLYSDLTQRIQETENAITLKGLDIKITASKAAKAQSLELKKIKKNINNDIYIEENRSDLYEPNKQFYALALNAATRHLLPNILRARVYQFPEKDLL